LHEILGFTKSFKANFPCRKCKISKEGLQSCFREDSNLVRNEDNYKADVTTNDLSKTGISEDCTFHRINSFKVWENTCFDVMHDFLEGILHYDISLILKFFISNNLLTLDDLNNQKQSFDYGPLKQGIYNLDVFV
jgi:hypothetical protein